MIYLKTKIANNIYEAWEIFETISIGRTASNDILIEDQLCSRHHAGVYFEDKKVVLEDYGSSLGTFVNGERVEKTNLCNGDVITIAQQEFLFVKSKLDTLPDNIDLTYSNIGNLNFSSILSSRHLRIVFPFRIEIVENVYFILRQKIEQLCVDSSTKDEIYQFIVCCITNSIEHYESTASSTWEIRYLLKSDKLIIRLCDYGEKQNLRELILASKKAILAKNKDALQLVFDQFDEIEFRPLTSMISAIRVLNGQQYTNNEMLETMQSFAQRHKDRENPLRVRLEKAIQSSYRIVGELGRGGMGVVFKARHLRLNKYAAIKTVHSQEAWDSETILQRFHQEAQILDMLDNPHIPKILDVNSTEDGLLYIIMEFTPGITLDQWMRSRKLKLFEILDIARQIFEILGYTYEKNILHRDLKPQNILVELKGDKYTVSILDFGVAKILHNAEKIPLTQQGVSVGTIQYMSPEQFHTQPVDVRTDIYSAGVILYEMLCGERPLQAQNIHEFIGKLLPPGEKPASLLQKKLFFAIPEELNDLVMQTLEKEVDKRPGNPGAISTKLAEIQKIL